MPKKSKPLIIVESPTKAKTISKFLGKDFTVLSSFGHIRDLPKNALGIDLENHFAPKYVIPMKAKKVAAELKKAAAKAGEVYFASDEDREGEAIAWHLFAILDIPQENTHRIAFHEITEHAIKHAIQNPRRIDTNLVEAQQARRILDRLVGYKLSPFLWRKITYGLSAGRVQSVVVRLIVEREREIQAFVPQEYWTVEADVHKKNENEIFTARLTKKDGESLDKFALGTEADAMAVVKDLENATMTVASVEKKTTKRSPYAPFTTSTLQQEANNRLGFSAKQTMMIAQQLYEGVELGSDGSTGLITYMRTDSVNLSDKFLEESREWIMKTHGKNALPDEARKYKTKSKGAQEAHEAIRPANALLTPNDVAPYLDERQMKLYTLIWNRAVASQMNDAELLSVGIDITSGAFTLRASGSTIQSKGFLEVYETDTKETFLPELSEGDIIEANEIIPKQHFTEPPPRYTEASLVKTLEENGIGRPSTYAPTISTVVDRGYVQKDGKKLAPTDLAFTVNDLLVEHFGNIVDYNFTAKMEEDLDDVAEGKKEWVPVLKNFFDPFIKNLDEKEKEISKEDLQQTTDEKCEKCEKQMIIKIGRFGKFLACTGYPGCKTTKPMPGSKEAEESEETIDEKCDECGSTMVIKRGRFGRFLSCSRYPECKTNKPLLKKTGAKCTKCDKGEVVEKKTKRGRPFYSCSQYPNCDFALWSKPTGETCPQCKQLLIFAKEGIVRCSNTDCTYEKTS